MLTLTKFFIEGNLILICTTKGLFDNFEKRKGEIISFVKLGDYLKIFPLINK